MSSDRCSGSWLVDENGVGKRPPCVFCNGATDIVIEPPSERLPPPQIATEGPGQALPPPQIATEGPGQALPPPQIASEGPGQALPPPEIASEGPGQARPPKCVTPKINWTGCDRTKSCDACFFIEYAQGDSDIMCLAKDPNAECIFTGQIISDGSYAAVTASNGRCRPFGTDPLEVSHISFL